MENALTVLFQRLLEKEGKSFFIFCRNILHLDIKQSQSLLLLLLSTLANMDGLLHL